MEILKSRKIRKFRAKVLSRERELTHPHVNGGKPYMIDIDSIRLPADGKVNVDRNHSKITIGRLAEFSKEKDGLYASFYTNDVKTAREIGQRLPLGFSPTLGFDENSQDVIMGGVVVDFSIVDRPTDNGTHFVY